MSTENEDLHKMGKELGYLPYMIDRYISILGENETKELLQFNETELPQIIRLNSLRNSIEETEKLLNQKQVQIEKIEGIPEARKIVKSPIPIGASEEYLNGYYTLQGKNSLIPTRILNPKEGDLVADLAAAPGGKTSHLAQLMNNKGIIIAIEVSANRCRGLKSNLARMGVENTIVFNMDANEIISLNLKFDKILLDAPCSGSGIIVSDSTRKSSKSLDDLHNYHNLQYSLLSNAINALTPHGELVYSTCSLEPEENELVISRILDSNDVKVEKIDFVGNQGLEKFQDFNYNPEVVKARRLYPHKTCGEGFFITKLVKV